MNNIILLLTHGEVGQAMKDAASSTLGFVNNELLVLSVSNQLKLEQIKEKLEVLIHKHAKEHILILTDLFGSTPCNIASLFTKKNRVCVISGLNLGMLLKSLNYINLPFNELIKKAALGGKECIKTCK